MPIPKTIHVVWIGDETKRPDRWITTWADMNPAYELHIWGNAAVQSQSWILGDQINAWIDREINGAADMIRWEVLFRHGGIAFDADSACVRPLEDWLLEPDGFAAWENELLRPGLMAAGALGFVPGHPLVANIIKDIMADPDPFGGMAWQKLGPQRITDTVRRLGFPNLTVYPSHFFFPRHYTGLEYSGTGPVFARQFWGSTHRGWGIENPSGTGQDPQPEQDATSADGPASDTIGKPEPVSLSGQVSPSIPAVVEPSVILEPAAPRQLIERGWNNSFYLQRMRVSEVAERLPYFRALCRDKKVLHVGCTDFPVFDPSRNLHIQIQDVCAGLDGLDTDREGMATLSQYVRGRYYSTTDDIAQSYDLMLVPETIEHVGNIKLFLEDLDRVDTGQVLITAPCLIGWANCFNYRGCAGRQAKLLSRPDDYIEEIHPDHKAWFTPYTLANCVEQFTAWRIDEIMFLEGRRMAAVRCSPS